MLYSSLSFSSRRWYAANGAATNRHQVVHNSLLCVALGGLLDDGQQHPKVTEIIVDGGVFLHSR